MILTESQKRALEIVRDHGPIRPREFAKFMWPDSDGHKHHTKCGYGVTTGGGMNLAGGGYLGKLRYLGLVRERYEFGSRGYQIQGYVITLGGLNSLEATEQALKNSEEENGSCTT